MNSGDGGLFRGAFHDGQIADTLAAGRPDALRIADCLARHQPGDRGRPSSAVIMSRQPTDRTPICDFFSSIYVVSSSFGGTLIAVIVQQRSACLNLK